MNSKDLTTSAYSIFRPNKIGEIIGHKYIVDFLTRSIEKNMIPSFVFFYGFYGVGKTTAARIYAKAANCLDTSDSMLKPCDVCINCLNSSSYLYEYNSSNYTQVDNMRDLIEDAQYMPYYGKYKFYILDEFHMLSQKAFNILLKEVEEPQSYVRYIGITTNIESIPKALVSRAICLLFKNLTSEELLVLKKRLVTLSEEYGFKADDNMLDSIFKSDSIFNISAREVVNKFIEKIILKDDDTVQVDLTKYINNLFLPSDISMNNKLPILNELIINNSLIEEVLNETLKILIKKVIENSDSCMVSSQMYTKVSEELIKYFDYDIRNLNTLYLLVAKFHFIYKTTNESNKY